MSDYPLSHDDPLLAAAPATLSSDRLFRERFAAVNEDDLSEHHFDWDSAALVAPGGLSPARQLAMQRQQERLSSMPPRDPQQPAAIVIP